MNQKFFQSWLKKKLKSTGQLCPVLETYHYLQSLLAIFSKMAEEEEEEEDEEEVTNKFL